LTDVLYHITIILLHAIENESDAIRFNPDDNTVIWITFLWMSILSIWRARLIKY